MIDHFVREKTSNKRWHQRHVSIFFTSKCLPPTKALTNSTKFTDWLRHGASRIIRALTRSYSSDLLFECIGRCCCTRLCNWGWCRACVGGGLRHWRPQDHIQVSRGTNWPCSDRRFVPQVLIFAIAQPLRFQTCIRLAYHVKYLSECCRHILQH